MSDSSAIAGYRLWLLASRPKTLWAALSPVLIGTALAVGVGPVHLLAAAAAAAGAVLIQIGTNFANDLVDYQKQVDTSDRLGPLRVTQAGLVTPTQMKYATTIVFAAALLVGVYLVWRAGWPVVVIGLLSILFGIIYTAGPYPLGYNGLGDLFVLIFFGPVAVAGTYYVITLDITVAVVIAGIPPGLLATAILVVNNLRDIETDSDTGKRTLAVRFGREFARYEYLVMILGAALYPLVNLLVTGGHAGTLLATVTLVSAVSPLRRVFTACDAEVLNQVLAATGRVMFLYSLAFSVGWLL